MASQRVVSRALLALAVLSLSAACGDAGGSVATSNDPDAAPIEAGAWDAGSACWWCSDATGDPRDAFAIEGGGKPCYTKCLKDGYYTAVCGFLCFAVQPSNDGAVTCYKDCIDAGGSVPSCDKKCYVWGETDDAKKMRKCFDGCIEAGKTVDACKTACFAKQLCYWDCVEAGKHADDCRQTCNESK